jgi:PIN domain nuclease of toxin-antitoxin system
LIFILDASAMIAYLRDETGAEKVTQALAEPLNQCVAHAVNLCEVFYDFYRASGPDIAVEALSDLARVGVVENAQITRDFWQRVGALKAVHRHVSLADCFLIALANQLQATVLTADHHEFDAMANQAVCAIDFIR